LDYDVSLDDVVDLIVVIPMSPRSSKMESGCKSYHYFRIACSSWPDYLGQTWAELSGGRLSGQKWKYLAQ
jgi:hypothetical protein